jgi:uncharacterized protein DUF4287
VSFQAYLDNIQAKTGKPAGEIAGLVRDQGLTKPSAIIAWLKTEFDLGYGHSMAIVAVMRREGLLPPAKAKARG